MLCHCAFPIASHDCTLKDECMLLAANFAAELCTVMLALSEDEWEVMPHHHRSYAAKCVAIAGVTLGGVQDLLGLRF